MKNLLKKLNCEDIVRSLWRHKEISRNTDSLLKDKDLYISIDSKY